MTTTFNNILSELKILDKRTHDAEETVKTLRDRLEVRNDEIAELKAALALRDEELCEMNNRVNERDNEIAELGNRLNERDNEINKLRVSELQELACTKLALDKKQEYIAELEKKVRELTEANAELATCPASCLDVRERATRITYLEKQVADLHQEISNKTVTMNIKDGLIDDLKDKLEDARNVIDKMEKDFEVHQQRHIARKNYVQALEGDNTQLCIKLQKIRELAYVKND